MPIPNDLTIINTPFGVFRGWLTPPKREDEQPEHELSVLKAPKRPKFDPVAKDARFLREREALAEKQIAWKKKKKEEETARKRAVSKQKKALADQRAVARFNRSRRKK